MEEQSIFLHKNIKCLRRRLKLSQEELATRVGLNRGNIASYEKGIAEPKNCNLLKFSNLFCVSVGDLIRKDLSTEEFYHDACNKYHNISDSEKATLEDYEAHSKEIKAVINSIYRCHCHKSKSLDVNDKNIQVMIGNFEHLNDVTNQLLELHQSLLDFIQCRTK
jgi:transcriptional regulator with XRE-family HTH domain